MERRVNFDYLNIWKEIPLFCALIMRHLLAPKPREAGALLIVNPCLVGEFAATAPAMADFIARHPGRAVDLIVSPPLVGVAERMRGVRRVYPAVSVFARAAEGAGEYRGALGPYQEVRVMRMSAGAYRLLAQVSCRRLRTALPHFLRYAGHLSLSIMQGRTPRSWREVNFAVLGATPRPVPFEAIFDAPEGTRGGGLVVHVGASWVMNRWPLERWAALLRRIHDAYGMPISFVGTPKEAAAYEAISARLPFRVISHIGAHSVWELLLFIRSADYLIGVDSGPRNLAHLADTPSMTLLGPAPHMYAPPHPRDIAIDKSGGRGLYERFVARPYPLIERISVDEAFGAFEELVRRARGA